MHQPYVAPPCCHTTPFMCAICLIACPWHAIGVQVRGPAIRDMSDRVSWVEKFVAVGAAAQEAAQKERPQAQVGKPPHRCALACMLGCMIRSNSTIVWSTIVVVILSSHQHYVGFPTRMPFPLLSHLWACNSASVCICLLHASMAYTTVPHHLCAVCSMHTGGPSLDDP